MYFSPVRASTGARAQSKTAKLWAKPAKSAMGSLMGPSFSQSIAPVSDDSIVASGAFAVGSSPKSKDVFASEAAAAGLILVELSGPRPTLRGRLAFFIDGAIERALDARGAPAPRASSNGDFDASLGDQVERAQISGATGLALWFGPLDEVAKAGILDCDDCVAIRRLKHAAREQAVRIGFDPRNLALYAYPDPEPFVSVFADDLRVTPPSEPERSQDALVDEARAGMADVDDGEKRDADARDSASALASDDAGSVAAEPSTPEADETGAHVGAAAGDSLAESARAMADELAGDENSDWLREALIELSTPKPRPAIDEVRAVRRELSDAIVLDAEPPVVLTGADPADFSDPTPAESSGAAPFHIAFAEAAVEPPKPAVDPELRKRLESAARELEFANGPKPLAVVERLFASAYVPLRGALDRGTSLPAVAETADEWARSFEKSYTEAFDALKMRTKRPKMIPDLPDIALRIGRLHGARSVQLLLVDGMRFDLGESVHDRLRALSGQRAACAERLIVWSALPTRTAAQVELLGRGPAGLREFTGEVSEDLVVARGRKASMIRRLKAGHREVLKLDVVEARLGEPGCVTPERLDGIAEEVSQRVAAYFEDLQPRTLVLVFGDHGFRLVTGGEGLVTARQGGAFPEEVLVPAYAWLVGAVH